MKQPIKRPEVGKCYLVTNYDDTTYYIKFSIVKKGRYSDSWGGEGATIYDNRSIRTDRSRYLILPNSKLREVSPTTWNRAVRRCIDAANKQLIDVTPKKKKRSGE